MNTVLPLERLGEWVLPQDRDILHREWPQGIPLTPSTARRLAELNLNIRCAVGNLLTREEQRQFLTNTAGVTQQLRQELRARAAEVHQARGLLRAQPMRQSQRELHQEWLHQSALELIRLLRLQQPDTQSPRRSP